MQRPVEFYSGGEVLRGNFHLPRGSPPFPGVLLIPGFADTAVGMHNMHVWMARSLQRQGCAVLRFDYRGLGESEGNFREFTVSSGMEDVKNALKALKLQPDVVHNCIGLIGFSLGGALAVQVASETVDTVLALGLLAPVASMRAVFHSFFTEAQLLQAQESGWIDWMGWPVGLRFLETLDAIDPLRAFAMVKLPTLVVHGDADREVPPSNGKAFANLGAELRRIRCADHLFSSVRYQEEAVDAMTKWFVSKLITGRKQA